MLLARSISLAVGLLIGVSSSQLPEYAQQYRQRLGGAVDELREVVATFDADSLKAGLSRAAGMERLRGDPDAFVQGRAQQMDANIARMERLQSQQQALASAGSFSRIALMLRQFDPAVARGAYAAFEPGLPVSSEGFFAGFLGFLGGGLVFHGLGTPFRRRRRVAAGL